MNLVPSVPDRKMSSVKSPYFVQGIAHCLPEERGRSVRAIETDASFVENFLLLVTLSASVFHCSMRLDGVEPATSAISGQRSTN